MKVSLYRGDLIPLAQLGSIEHEIQSYQVAQVRRILNNYDDFEPLPAFVPSDDRPSDIEPLSAFSQHGKIEQARANGDDDNDRPSDFEPLPAFSQHQEGDLAARGNRDDDDDRPSDFEPLPAFSQRQEKEHTNQPPQGASLLIPSSSSRTPSVPANFRTWSNNGTSSHVPHQEHSSTNVRTAASKGERSNQHERHPKRPTLNRDNSATANRLKEQYIPEVFHRAQRFAGKHLRSDNQRVFESSLPEPLHDDDRMTTPPCLTVDQITGAIQMLQKSELFAGNGSSNSLDYHHLYSSGPSIVTPEHSTRTTEILDMFPVSNSTGMSSSMQLYTELQKL